MKKLFLDLSGLTKEDIQDIKAIGNAFNLNFNESLYKFMNENPNKVKVLGEMNNGVITRDEISIDGVKEYTGNDAICRILEQIRKNKEGEE